jgi:hypothetical protein
MSKFKILPQIVLCALGGLLLIQCAPTAKIHPEFQKMKPKVVVVLPPENTTSATQVEEIAYPILYEKLSNRGYYCISPEMARAIFNSSRLEDAGRINQLPVEKFKEIFGADAVLRTKITDWSSKYYVISSNVTITLESQLIDTKSSQELWSMKNTISKAPDNQGGGIAGALIGAIVNAAFTPYEPIMEDNAKAVLTTVPLGDYGKSTPNK